MKIGRVINADLSIYEDCNGSLFNFGYQLDASWAKPLFRYNRDYGNMFDNITFCLPNKEIEEIEVFTVVKNNFCKKNNKKVRSYSN